MRGRSRRPRKQAQEPSDRPCRGVERFDREPAILASQKIETRPGKAGHGLDEIQRAGVVEWSPGPFRYSRCLAWCGHAALRAGELDRAARFAEEALAQSRSRGEQGYELEARHLGAEVAARAGGSAADRAARELAETAERAAALGLRPLVAHCRLSAGELWARRGDRGRAREHLAAAGALYQALGMPLYAARAERAALDA